MKRAEVFRARRSSREQWRVVVHEGEIPERHLPIWHRDPGTYETPHPTHEAALAHALAEVGLDRPAEHREAP